MVEWLGQSKLFYVPNGNVSSLASGARRGSFTPFVCAHLKVSGLRLVVAQNHRRSRYFSHRSNVLCVNSSVVASQGLPQAASDLISRDGRPGAA